MNAFLNVLKHRHVTLFRINLGDKAAEKEFHIAIQMTLEHISSEIQENRNGRKKATFNKDT